MAPPREYRWVEERARAPKISPSAWREHEPKIRELHRTKTLKQLMEYMEETFGFTPSRRQYVCQLKEWNLGKYKTGPGTAIPEASHLPETGNILETCDFADSVDVPEASNVSPGLVDDHSDPSQSTPSTVIRDSDSGYDFYSNSYFPEQQKRSRDLASVRSSTSSSILRTRPPTKKGRHGVGPSQGETLTDQTITYIADSSMSPASYPQQRSPHAEIGDVAETVQALDELRERSFRVFAQSMGVDEWLQPLGQQPSLPPRQPSWASFPPRHIARISSQTQQTLRASFPPQQPSFPSQWTSGDEMSKICRTFTNHRISTIMEQDYANIEIAVDYMEALERHEDAFALHIMLLKRNLSRQRPDKREHLLRMIKCSRCISKPEHFELVHHHLRQEYLEQLQGAAWSNPVERFLVNMALAEMYIRRYDTELAKTHILYARASIPREASTWNEKYCTPLPIVELSTSAGQFRGAAQLMSRLPPDDRSFDLALYYYIQVDRGYQRTVGDFMAEESFVPTWEQLGPWFCQVPGPFELGKICIHGDLCCDSCRVRGLSCKLPAASSVCDESLFIHSSCLKAGRCEVDEAGLHLQNPCIRSCLLWCGLVLRYGERADLDFWTNCVEREESREPSDYPKRALKALFTKLLSIWTQGSLVMDLPMRTREDVVVWQTHASVRMGISPTALLRITCGYIINESSVNPSERGKPAPVRLTIAKLLRSTDTQIAFHFLDELTRYRRSVAQSEWNSVMAELPPQTHISAAWLLENQGLTFVHPIVAAAAYPAPAVTENTTSTAARSKAHAEMIYGSSVTMASSRGSSDKSLINFRTAGKRVTDTVMRLKGQLPARLSGSEYGTGPMGSRLSQRSGIDALSDSFTRMSLVATAEAEEPEDLVGMEERPVVAGGHHWPLLATPGGSS